jgi:hypothetical protein
LGTAQDPGELVRLIRQRLLNPEIEETMPELFLKLNDWCGQPHPDDLLRREDSVQESYRALKIANTDMAVAKALKRLWSALEAKGLDRPLHRPESREASDRDHQLVCRKWIIPESQCKPVNQSDRRKLYENLP